MQFKFCLSVERLYLFVQLFIMWYENKKNVWELIPQNTKDSF
jgi:hypothetical protein